MSDTPDIIGRGFTFPFRVDKTGSIALTTGADDIESAMRVILCTAPGERVMRPDFGCAVHDLIFAPNNANTHGLVIYYVKEALTKWEPRIQALDVKVNLDRDEQSRINSEIKYQVIATNNVYNLVYPFYLQKSP